MRDVLEAVAKVLKDLSGFEVSQNWMPYIIVLTAIGPWLVWGYLSIRRWRGDFKAISGELEAATKIISQDTKQEFDHVLKKFSLIEENLRGTIETRFDALHAFLRSTTSVGGSADDEIEKEPAASTQSSRTRLNAAEAVRNMVIEKWLAGRSFKKRDVEPYTFWFEGISDAGSKIKLLLRTPYRISLGDDGSLPYTLEVWVDGYKKLNFEWDLEGNYALRGLKKGDWIEDIALWQFGAAQEKRGEQVAA